MLQTEMSPQAAQSTPPSLTSQERMTRLAESFPVLRGFHGVRPWNHIAFAKTAVGGHMTSASRQAAAFVLSVWNGSCLEYSGRKPSLKTWWNDGEFRAGTFDAIYAFGVWDHQHQAAYIAWCQKPFWP